jgi:drug/metabolite transporter (DMT)-like permease
MVMVATSASARPATATALVVGVVLASSVLHAAWNALTKVMPDQFTAFALLAATESVWGAAVWAATGGPRMGSWPFLAGSAVIHVAYSITLLNSYRFGDLSQVYPLARGLAPLMVAGLAALVAGETLAPLQIGGVAVVAGGLTSLVGLRAFRRLGDRRGVVLAVATGVGIAAYTVIDGLGVRRAGGALSYAGPLFLLQGVVVCAILTALLARRRRLVPERNWWLGVLAGLLSVTTYWMVLWAQTRAALALVSALRETSVVTGALIGSLFLSEGKTWRRVGSAAVVAVGVVLLVAA